MWQSRRRRTRKRGGIPAPSSLDIFFLLLSDFPHYPFPRTGKKPRKKSQKRITPQRKSDVKNVAFKYLRKSHSSSTREVYLPDCLTPQLVPQSVLFVEIYVNKMNSPGPCIDLYNIVYFSQNSQRDIERLKKRNVNKIEGEKKSTVTKTMGPLLVQYISYYYHIMGGAGKKKEKTTPIYPPPGQNEKHFRGVGFMYYFFFLSTAIFFTWF